MQQHVFTEGRFIKIIWIWLIPILIIDLIFNLKLVWKWLKHEDNQHDHTMFRGKKKKKGN